MCAAGSGDAHHRTDRNAARDLGQQGAACLESSAADREGLDTLSERLGELDEVTLESAWRGRMQALGV
jgi:hypothetical protein